LILTSGARDRCVLIEGLLKSIAMQTVKPDEVLIATETAGKELGKLAEKYLEDINYRVLETGYWNRCWTANKAILSARGDVIFLLEDDLYLTPRFIEEALNAFREYPEAGCIYTNCIWVFREGLSSRSGLMGSIARAVGKLTIHESVLPTMTNRINDHLVEVPVFTMSVACRKEALLRTGLYDMRVQEPILGEDYDLALRIRKAGYRIVQTSKAVSYHLTMQVTKGTIKYGKDPRKLMGTYESEVYFIAKNKDALGTMHVVSHAVYKIIESVAWSVRSRNPLTAIYGVAGVIRGLAKGAGTLLK